MTRAQQVLSECARLWAPPPQAEPFRLGRRNFILSSEYSASSVGCNSIASRVEFSMRLPTRTPGVPW